MITMYENIHSLQSFLNSTTIPKIEIKPKTFLEIAKQPHFENVLSNIYAFFLNIDEEHGFKDLFIRSLLGCIEEKVLEKQKDFIFFSDFDIQTEYPTKGLGKSKKRGRIDLLLTNSDQAILIENKVYHHLANDLDDYWLSVKLPNDTSKIGIILSLKPISEDNWKQFEYKDHFINLTHYELMTKVVQFKEEYIAQSNPHFHFVLEDLIQNINKISNPVMNQENIQFFLENKEKINQLQALKNEFRNHVIAQVENADYCNSNLEIFRQRTSQNGRLRYFQSKTQRDIMYVIVFEELFQDSNLLHIIIEIRGETLKRAEDFRKISFDSIEQSIIKNNFYHQSEAAWAHFAHKAYRMKESEIADLSAFIQEKIRTDYFGSVFEKLETFLTYRKKG